MKSFAFVLFALLGSTAAYAANHKCQTGTRWNNTYFCCASGSSCGACPAGYYYSPDRWKYQQKFCMENGTTYHHSSSKKKK